MVVVEREPMEVDVAVVVLGFIVAAAGRGIGNGEVAAASLVGLCGGDLVCGSAGIASERAANMV